MKKMFLTLAILSGFVLAQEVRNLDNMKVMKDLEKATGLILKGFMYNHESVVENGVKQIQELVKNSEKFVIPEEHAKAAGFDKNKYAQNEAKDLGKLAGEVLTLYKSGQKDKATGTYSVILNKCINCHKVVRAW